MKQIVIPRHGAPDVLQLREAPDPEVQPGQIRIRVKSSGVNFADTSARLGLYPDAPPLPLVVGYEVAGIVDGVGAGAIGVRDGDRVIAFTHFGGYSDVVNVPHDFVYALPDSLPFEKGAAIPVAYITAWVMLDLLGNVRRGDTVLVHAAAGGVGIAALQICKLKGAQVIGTASPGKHARLRELGVAHCIDYTTQDFAPEVTRLTGGRGVDVALDAVGGASHRKSYECLAPLGRLFMFGGSAFTPGATRSIPTMVKQFFSMPTFKPFKLMEQNRGVFGINLAKLWGEAARLRASMADLLPLFEKGDLDPIVDKTFPFEHAAEAHAYLHDRQNFGKVLLIP
jgi:NADPH:quinone reductase-like Zn-dependent oxidoreductase